MGTRTNKNGDVIKYVIIGVKLEEHNALKAFVALKNVSIKQYVYEALQEKLREDGSRQ